MVLRGHWTHTGIAQDFWLGFTMTGQCLKAQSSIDTCEVCLVITVAMCCFEDSVCKLQLLCLNFNDIGIVFLVNVSALLIKNACNNVVDSESVLLSRHMVKFNFISDAFLAVFVCVSVQ